MAKDSLVYWLQKRGNTKPCPDCGGQVPNSWMKYTNICSKCGRVWTMRRSQWSWKWWWYYVEVDKEGNRIPYSSKEATIGERKPR